ncbi:MAG TPA: hypothetical protein VIW03_11220, partial [Anaeromyxobacter sp.]
MIARAAAIAVAGVLAVPAARAADDVLVQAVLHTRFTDLGSAPGQDVRFDRASRTFDLSGYLVPSRSTSYGSAFASFALDGSALAGDLHWRLALDTGELRERSFPRRTAVCWTERGTGLSDTGPCDLYPRSRGVPVAGARPIFSTVDDTRDGQRQLTSNGRPLREEVEATLLVREAYAALSFGRAGFATVRAGRKRVTVADGFVH